MGIFTSIIGIGKRSAAHLGCLLLVTLGSVMAASGSGNSLLVIKPYWHNGTWVFDDAKRDLLAEPFVLGVDQMITELVQDIPDAREGFTLIFSQQEFPGHEVTLTRLREEDGGWWYQRQSDGKQGWLCPALFAYFPEAPERIHARADASGETTTSPIGTLRDDAASLMTQISRMAGELDTEQAEQVRVFLESYITPDAIASRNIVINDDLVHHFMTKNQEQLRTILQFIADQNLPAERIGGAWRIALDRDQVSSPRDHIEFIYSAASGHFHIRN